MKIVELNTELEPLFWEHVNRDLPHYYFFAHDWRNFRSETEILLALGAVSYTHLRAHET